MNLLYRAVLATSLLTSPPNAPGSDIACLAEDRRAVPISAGTRWFVGDALARRIALEAVCRCGCARLPSFELGETARGAKEMLFPDDMPMEERTRSYAIIRNVVRRILQVDPALRGEYPDLFIALIPTPDVEKVVTVELQQALPRLAPGQPPRQSHLHHMYDVYENPESVLIIRSDLLDERSFTFYEVARLLHASRAHRDVVPGTPDAAHAALCRAEGVVGAMRTLSELLEQTRKQNPAAMTQETDELIVELEAFLAANRAEHERQQKVLETKLRK